MFERYSEDARRVIFFAHRETVKCGAAAIGPEHLLLGLLHDSGSRANRLFGLNKNASSFRQKIVQKQPPSKSHPKVGVFGDLPLTNASKRVLAYTADEADRVRSRDIDTGHILLGLLREESFATTLLSEIGLDLKIARNTINGTGSRYRSRPDDTRKTFSPAVGIVLILLLLFAIYWVVRLALGR